MHEHGIACVVCLENLSYNTTFYKYKFWFPTVKTMLPLLMISINIQTSIYCSESNKVCEYALCSNM